MRRLVPLDLADVTIEDAFWAPRRETVRTRTLPQQERRLRTPGQQLDALRLGWRPGDPDEPHIFWESDVAKWIEAASYVLTTRPDPALEASVEEAVALLAGAQQPDGYLNVYFTVVRPGERFTDLRDAHELYCLGHLIEAAVAHHRATGRTTLLDVVRRYADLVERELGPGGPFEGAYDGHEEIELALVKLARATGERRYLDLARWFLDVRGTQPFWFDGEEDRRGHQGYFGGRAPGRRRREAADREYHQAHRPVREQEEVVGHSVRATYLLAAMADVAAEDDDADLLAACERLWESTTGTKMYVTGGLGSNPAIEGFSAPFELPDKDGYAETCAAIGLVLWAQRMVNLSGDGRYADVLEQALYNGVLAGVSADGTSYFYGNPLASDGSAHRQEWFGCACCPPNLARLLASLEAYAYGESDDVLAVHLHVAGTVRTRAGGGAVVRVETDLPRSGAVALTVESATGEPWTLAVRVPGWSQETAVLVNGEPADVGGATDRGYVRLHRAWAPGDRVELGLDLTPRRVWADPRVRSASGRVALQRGPVVHCFEGVDHDAPADALVLPRSATLGLEDEPVSGLVALTTDGWAEESPDGLYRTDPAGRRPQRLRAVPYFAWGNRGRDTMTVWVREDASA